MIERRFRSRVELRADSQGDEMYISGYAATWGTISEPLAGFRERLSPGCFTRSLQSDRDVKCNLNHSPDAILGRKKNGTLKVSEDTRGLYFRCNVAPTSTGRDVFRLIQRSDLSDCSFAFDCVDQSWDEIDDPSDRDLRIPLRTIRTANLWDVAVVGSPAYSGTSVSAIPEMNSTNTEDLDTVWAGPTPRGLTDCFPEGLPSNFPVEMRSRIITANQQRSKSREARQRMMDFILSL